MGESLFPAPKLQELANVLRLRYHLNQVYFVIRKGTRAHYLCGCGRIGFDRAGQMDIGNGLAVYWHGELSQQHRMDMKESIRNALGGVPKVR